MTRWLWLGLRLSVGSGRAGALRTALMASGAAIGVFMVLAGLAAATVATNQHDRARARTPVPAPDSVTPLRMVEIEDGIGTRVLRRTAVLGAAADSPRPPGLDAYPGPGEVVVSPALADLMRVDPRAAERFPQRVVGVIKPAGLVAPDELRAYVGVPVDDPYLSGDRPDGEELAVNGFGAPLQYADGAQVPAPDVFSPGRWAAAAFALFVLVPFGAFLATCARLSATTRDRRIAALRLLGISARQATLVNVVETGVVAAAGALLGTLAFAVLAPLSGGWRIGRLHWYTTDISLPTGWIAAALTATVLFAVLVGVLATQPARSNPLSVRHGGATGRPSPWRALPLSAGLTAALIAALPDEATYPTATGLTFIGALLVTGLSLPLVLPLLAYWLAVAVGRLPRGPVWLDLATARIRNTPGVAPRLVASLAVTLYVIGIGSLGAAVFTNDRALSIGGGQPSPLYSIRSADPELIAALRTIPDLSVVDMASVPVTMNGQQQSIMVTDCTYVRAMYVIAAGESCVDGEAYRLSYPDWHWLGLGPAAGVEAIAENGARIAAPEKTLILALRHDIGQISALLVTRQSPLAANLPPAESWPNVITHDREAADRAARLVSARTPTNYFGGAVVTHQGLDSDLLLTLLVTGLTVSLVLGMGSFTAAAVDRSMERRRDNATLAVVGVSPATITAGETGFVGLPLVIGIGTAGVATITVGASLAAILDIPASAVFDRIAPILWLGLGATALGLILIAVPAWFTQRITAEQLRRP